MIDDFVVTANRFKRLSTLAREPLKTCFTAATCLKYTTDDAEAFMIALYLFVF